MKSHLLQYGSIILNTTTGTDGNPGSSGTGTLGKGPLTPISGGILDFRPWEEKPPGGATNWAKVTTAVPSGQATLRMQFQQPLNQFSTDADGNIAVLGRTTDWMRNTSLMVMFAAWDIMPEDFPDLNQMTRADLSDDNLQWRLLSIGPDLMSAFMTQTSVEVDLTKLIGGLRFATFYVWPVWMGFLLPAPSSTIGANPTWFWTVRDDPPVACQLQTLGFTIPVLRLKVGATVGTDMDLTEAVAKFGRKPWSRRNKLRVSMTNGCSEGVSGYLMTYCNQCQITGTAFSIAGSTSAVGQGDILGTTLDEAITHFVLYATSDDASLTGGPCLVQVSPA